MAEPAHSRDLRKGRHSERSRVYHGRTSTEGRKPLFLDFRLDREVVRSRRFLHEHGDVENLAFVVMLDHLHWLFRLARDRPLDRLMLSLKSCTARAINQRRGVVNEAVWQEGYFDRALRAEEDIRAVARYIVANPLRANLSKHIGDYPLWDAIWL